MAKKMRLRKKPEGRQRSLPAAGTALPAHFRRLPHRIGNRFTKNGNGTTKQSDTKNRIDQKIAFRMKLIQFHRYTERLRYSRYQQM